MAFLQVNNVEVVGMAVTVPSTIEETVSIYENGEIMTISLPLQV